MEIGKDGRREKQRETATDKDLKNDAAIHVSKTESDNNVAMESKSLGRTILKSRILYSTKVYFKYEDRICSDIHELKNILYMCTFSAI